MTYRVWLVPSESVEGEEHRVFYEPIKGRFMCDCRGYTVHRTICRHIMKVIESLGGGS